MVQLAKVLLPIASLCVVFLSSKRRITFGISLVRDFFTVDLFILHCVVVCCDWLFLYTLIVSTVVIALLPVMMCPSVVFPTQSV